MSHRGLIGLVSLASSLVVACAVHPVWAAAGSSADDGPHLDYPAGANQPAPPSNAEQDTHHAFPVDANEPTARFVAAQRAHDRAEYLNAASAWYSIVQEPTLSRQQERTIAEYQLPVALTRLGLAHAAVPWFRVVTEGRDHPMHLAALIQLGRMAQELPAADPVLPQLGHFRSLDLERLRDLTADERARLAHFLGRGLYEAGNFSEAARAFERVGPSHDHFAEARLLESASHVRQHLSVPALLSLWRGVQAIVAGEARVSARAREHWLDLYHLSAARIYYSSAIALDPETNIPIINAARVSAAVKYYNLIEPESEYFEAATFELAWLYFMAGQYSFALGKIFTLDAPYFTSTLRPEALILKAVIYNANCNYDGATIVRARFFKRFIPIRDAVRQLLRQVKSGGSGSLVRVVHGLRHRTEVVGPILEPVLTAVYRERAFMRRLKSAGAIEAEIERFTRLPEQFRRSALGKALQSTLEIARSEAISRADEWLRAYLQRKIDAIDEQARNGERMLLYYYGSQRNLLDIKLKSGQVGKVESIHWGRVQGDEEHVLWPFDGEYWRDELGTYRQDILSTCGR